MISYDVNPHPHQCDVCGLIHLGPHGRPCDVPRLREAFRGVEITDDDERFLRWLAGWVDSTETLISLVERVRTKAGAP